jgi:hypothetical protein
VFDLVYGFVHGATPTNILNVLPSQGAWDYRSEVARHSHIMSDAHGFGEDKPDVHFVRRGWTQFSVTCSQDVLVSVTRKQSLKMYLVGQLRPLSHRYATTKHMYWRLCCRSSNFFGYIPLQNPAQLAGIEPNRP